jgi:carbon-monoxide dehydrogenase medium subunit
MRPVRFSYLRPQSVEEAVECLGEFGTDARVLAGGQSLLALMNQRRVRPAAVVDLSRLADLRYIRLDGGVLRIGALTTHRAVETVRDPAVRAGFGVLPDAARLVGQLPVRTRGTFGGSIAHAEPAAEWCVAAVLLDADLVLAGPRGIREIAAGDFFTGGRHGTGEHRTALGRDEVVVEVRLPRAAPTAALVEFAVQSGQFALVTAAAAVELDPHGVIVSARIVLGGVADRPIRLPWVERAILGGRPDEALPERAGSLAAGGLDPPPADHRADGWYRGELAAVLTARALRATLARAAVPRTSLAPAANRPAARQPERAGQR